MSSDQRRRPSKGKRDRPPWWTTGNCRLKVWVGPTTCYLVAYPKWGCPFIRAHAPRFLGMYQVRDFLDAFGIHVGNVMKKPVDLPANQPGRSAQVEDIVSRLPLLADHLTALFYEGDPPEARLPSTLLVFAEKGLWKAMLKDKNRGKCLWVSAASLLDVFDVMELALMDDHPDWRDDRSTGAPQASRQKK